MITAIIPARLASTRLPNKLLLDLEGKPVLQRVWEQVVQAAAVDAVHIATDAEQIAEQARSWGASVYMTSPECVSGTHRIASLLDQIEGTFFLNVQGDEPFIEPKLLDGLIHLWQQQQCDWVTAISRIQDSAALKDSNLVKAVIAQDGRALYFSRSPIPFVRDVDPDDWPNHHAYWGHIGVYGYTRGLLEKYPTLPPSPLETVEKLEQLRFLEYSFSGYTLVTDYQPIGIDTEADLETARHFLRNN